MTAGSGHPRGGWLVKLSGESLGGNAGTGVDSDAFQFIAGEIKKAKESAGPFAIVVGGGNFFRGRRGLGWPADRVTADQTGMLATVMNGLLLGDCLLSLGVSVAISSAFEIPGVLPKFHASEARADLNRDKIVLLVGGTGNPFFTTDTTACLRALELGVGTVIKATRVDGVFDTDPEKDSNARRYDRLSFDQAISDGLQIVDMTALTLCRENDLRLRVLNLGVADNLARAMSGLEIGTLVEK